MSRLRPNAFLLRIAALPADIQKILMEDIQNTIDNRITTMERIVAKDTKN